MRALHKTLALLALLFVFSVLSSSHSAQAAADPWLDEDFDDGVTGVFDTSFGLLPTTSGHQGEGLVSNILIGDHWGGTGHWYTKTHIGSEPEEMWMRYWLRFPTGFKVNPPYRGKLPGFGGLYTYNCLGNRPSTAGAPCWSARMSFSPVYASDGLPSYSYDPSKVTRISFYSYLLNSSGTGQDGKILNWDPDLSTLQHGRWYCIEARVKMNGLGAHNGVLEGYVDGDRAFAASNLTFRRASEPQLKVKSLWFDVYYGGDGTSPINNKIYFDSLAAGPERIGCNDRPKSSGTFYDDDDSVFEKAIERLAASGITQGCNPPANDRFCPEDSVTRGQMATFLKRALGDQYPVSLPNAPPSPPDFWGGRSHLEYKAALSVYSAGGAGFDTFGVNYWVDDSTGDKNWLATGTSGNPNIWVPTQLGRIWDAGSTPYIRITVNDLDGLASGRHDRRVDNMLKAFAAFTDLGGGRRVILDILPEPNVRNNPWGDDPSSFKTAFRNIATQARAEIGSSRVRIVF
ncbi:MAG TPA: S-layer homology domain-containing protein, partial [Acidimicrobiia bacterium]